MKKPVFNRITSALLLVFMVLGLTFSNELSINIFAAEGVPATTSLSSTPSSVAYSGTGTSSDPYRIAVAVGASCAPSKFWGDSTQSNGVGKFAVSFEEFTGNTTAGKLISSYTFDLGKNATSVWDGTWTYAYRFPAWTVFNTSTGSLRMAFPYKGNFDTYWTDWTYKFDAVGQTSGLAEDKQLKPGDTVVITHYGDYSESQTSRGTDYYVDFEEHMDYTGGGLLSGGIPNPVPITATAPVTASYYAVVDEDGYATFSGDNAIQYGGNYYVDKASISLEAENGRTSIDTKNGTLQLNASVSPSNAGQNVTWEIVQGSSLATIDQNGLLTAIANGQVVVRAYLDNYKSLYRDYTINITNQISTVKNISNGINATGYIPSDYELIVNPINSDKENIKSLFNIKSDSTVILGYYDIHFEKQGSVMTSDSPITLTFDVGNQYNGKTAVIYHNHNGKITQYSTVISDGKAVIQVENFSEFLVTISDTASDNAVINNPVTKDNTSYIYYVILIAASFGCIGFMNIRKNNKNENEI